MNKYKVALHYNKTIPVEVSANNEQEAIKNAQKIIESKPVYLTDDDSLPVCNITRILEGGEVIEVDELRIELDKEDIKKEIDTLHKKLQKHKYPHFILSATHQTGTGWASHGYFEGSTADMSNIVLGAFNVTPKIEPFYLTVAGLVLATVSAEKL